VASFDRNHWHDLFEIATASEVEKTRISFRIYLKKARPMILLIVGNGGIVSKTIKSVDQSSRKEPRKAKQA